MQTITCEQAMRTPRYSFLSRPPPPQKQEPTWAIPPPPVPVASLSATNPSGRRRASTIATWAALVQPGSPAPISPRRLSVSSLSRVGRRSSTSRSRAPSSALSGLVQLSPATQDIPVDLSAFGYTSVFAPKVPPAPSPLVRKAAMKKSSTPIVQPSSPGSTSRTLKRFRSLNILRRNKSTSQTTPASPSTKVQSRGGVVAKHDKAKYSHARPPPPLANDLALMQFIDGGSTESNAKRLMQHRARATGAKSGVDDIYRDGKGGFWLDRDEEMEYVHLLSGDFSSGNSTAEMQWVKFGSENGASPLKTGIVDLAGSRRESVSTNDSDLDPAYLVLPVEDTQCGPEDVILSSYNRVPQGSPLKSHSPVAPGLSVLSLPARPRRAAKHLRKSEFLVDVAAFGPRSPANRSSPKCSEFPSTSNPARKHGHFSSSFTLPSDSQEGLKVKRRPAPLKLAPVSVGWRRVEPSKTPRTVASEDARMSSTSTGVVAEASTALVSEVKPRRGKIIIASLDPKDDLAKCRDLAGRMMNRNIDDNNDVQREAAPVNTLNSGSAGKRMKLGLGGIFGRK